MKKIIIIVVLCFFCTSCSSVSKTVHTKLNPGRIEPIQQAAYCTYVFAACSKEAFYYQSSGGMLFVLDQDDNNIQLGSLNFVDDKPAGSSRNGLPASKYYSEMAGIGVGMQYFDNQLIYESEYSSSDGQIQYHLNSIDKTCSRFQTILSFDYQPSYFTLQNDVIAVAETIAENSGGVVHLYSLDGKELKKYEHHSNVVRITSNGNDIVIFCDGCMYAIDTISLEERILDEQENTAFLYLDGNRVAYCEYSPIEGTTALNVNTGIKNIKTGDVLFTKEDMIVDYFDDQYIYAMTIKEEHTKYLIYDWNGDLVKEIIPYDDLGTSNGAFPVAMNEMEYSNIVRVWNNQIIGNHFTDTEIELFVCDIETGKCHFLMY